MRVLAFSMMVALAVSAPAAAQQSAADAAYGLVGTWSCQSFAHSNGTWTITRDADNQISLKNHFVTEDGLQGEFDELYSVDPASGHWSVSATEPGRPGFLETMTAGPWNGDIWNFEGNLDQTLTPPAGAIQEARHFDQAIRMVYTRLAPGVFRREMETLRNGQWVSTSASTCKRA
jgi:hypothetical protein